MGRAVSSDSDRRYSCALATYAILEPSGAIATELRPVLVKFWPSPSSIGNLVTVGATAAGRCSAETANHVTAQTTAATRTKGAARFVHGGVAVGGTFPGLSALASAGVLIAKSAAAMSPTRCRRSFTRQ